MGRASICGPREPRPVPHAVTACDHERLGATVMPGPAGYQHPHPPGGRRHEKGNGRFELREEVISQRSLADCVGLREASSTQVKLSTALFDPLFQNEQNQK